MENEIVDPDSGAAIGVYDSPAFAGLKRLKHKVFVEEYCTGWQGGAKYDAQRAAEVAGYEGPSTGAALLRRQDIREAVDKRFAELALTTGEILSRFADVAVSTPGEIVVKDAHGNLRIDPDAVIRNRRFISEFGFDQNGNPKIKFHSPQEALRDLAKAHGMFRENVQVTGGGVPAELVVSFVRPDPVPEGEGEG